MKIAALLPFVSLLETAIAATPNKYFPVPTTKEDWDFCGLDYEPQCPPTITVEQAACEAPLVLLGRVLQSVNGETREDTVVQIQVDYRSEAFGSTTKTSIQKWGAGLDNQSEDSIFSNSSGFFTTWITAGFNNTPTDLAPAGFGTTPCGTRSPQSQETLYFFLEALPENEGKKVEFVENGNGALNVNFSLSTTMLQSGMVDDNADTYDLVEQGAFNAERLNGNCEVVYCCYNPGCGTCASVLAEVQGEFSCDSTMAPSGGHSMGEGAIIQILMIGFSTVATIAFFG